MNINKDNLWQLAIQFIKFGIVGVSNVFVSLAIYYILVYAGLHYILANAIGYCISILNAYFWNSRKVFKEKQDNELAALAKTFAAYGITFVLGSALLYLQVDLLSVSDKLAPVVSLFITIPVNFFMNKFWVYVKK